MKSCSLDRYKRADLESDLSMYQETFEGCEVRLVDICISPIRVHHPDVLSSSKLHHRCRLLSGVWNLFQQLESDIMSRHSPLGACRPSHGDSYSWRWQWSGRSWPVERRTFPQLRRIRRLRFPGLLPTVL